MQKYGTILVIDDNEAILTALRFCLKDTFEKVMTLTSPESIITLLGQEEVDIILLDMNFTLGVNNGQDGLVWLQAIRKHHPEIPVVLITAYADVQLAVRGLKRGAAAFIRRANNPAFTYRFDIVEVIGSRTSPDPPVVRHIEDAFRFPPNRRFVQK